MDFKTRQKNLQSLKKSKEELILNMLLSGDNKIIGVMPCMGKSVEYEFTIK